jgi:exopolysaccharide biosynthesis protein
MTRAPLLAAALLASAAAARPSQAQTRRVAPGVTHEHVADARGPWSIHVVRVDLRHADLALRAGRADDALRGREKTSDIARRAGALVAINADFFDLRTGENENNQVLAGEWWKGLKVTDSPYDTFDNVHAQLAVDAAGRASIDRYILDGTAWTRGATLPVLTVNAPVRATPAGAPEGTALFTARYGATTPRDTTRATVEVPLAPAGRRGDTLLFVRRGAPAESSGSAIPADGAVLAAYGPRAAELRPSAEGDTVRVRLATLPRLARGAAPSVVIGGWPRIVHDGASVAASAATVEGTVSRNAEVRHPRSAVGVTRDGATLILVTVDGRSARSVGMTLTELADAMRATGAWQALNFDGGGSTTMVVEGRVVNAPSDAAGEREVGNALLVVRRP